VTTWRGPQFSPTAIPLGDGKVGKTPRVGWVDSCQTSFPSKAGATSLAQPWINDKDHTWNPRAKVHVPGARSWSQASHSFVRDGSKRILTTNDLPTVGKTGDFPIPATSQAYKYDHNPNRVAVQHLSWTVPANPVAAVKPSCLPQGPVGVGANGVVLFDALDEQGRDARAHEIQDSCDGHPQEQDIYHYHSYSTCLNTAANMAAGSSTLIGYALDGYGIYLQRDEKGNLPTDADLDACHGITSVVTWNGKRVMMYHYDVTNEYPYLLGCFHGTPVNTALGGPSAAP
jgi:hypothetical protein